MSLSNSNIDTTKRISILSAAKPHRKNSENAASDQKLMDSIKYDQIACIIHQCDTSKSSSFDALRVYSAALPRHRWSRNHRTLSRLLKLRRILPARLVDN